MSSNSIVANLTSKDAISEIYLLLYEPKHLCKTFIVVEGDDDCKFLASLLESETILIQSYGSKNEVVSIIKILDKERVIGIVDRDYDYSNYGTKIFTYDYSCSEMTMVANDECIKKVLLNVNYEHYNDFKKVRLNVLQAIEVQGYLRKKNYEYGWNLKFDGVKPSNYYHINPVVLREQLYDEINKVSPIEKITPSRKIVLDSYVQNTSLQYLLDIANGHDFIQLFCFLYTKNFGKKHVSCLFRTAYGLENFKATNLYKALIEYQLVNSLNICKG